MAVLTLQSKGASGGDALIESLNPDFNFGLTQTLRAGVNGVNVSKGLLRFDLSALPAGAVISSAILTLHCVGQDSATGRSIGVSRALTQFYEGDKDNAIPTANGSTWSKRNYIFNVNWSGAVAGGQAGGDYVASPSGGSVVVGTVGADFTWTVTADVQLWANGLTNNGWWIFATTGETDTRKHFTSFEATTATQRPKLVITYTSNVNVTPTARFAVAGRAGPTTIKGAVTRAPNATASRGSALLGNVLAGNTLPGTDASAVAGTVNPTVSIGGSTSLGSVASARSSVVAPTVDVAALVPAPTPDNAKGVTVGPSLVIKGGAALTPNPAEAVGGNNGPSSLVDLTLRPNSATAIASTKGRAVALRLDPIECTPDPILVLTDGTFRGNGQRNWLSLIRNGIMLNNWNPNISQYKGGGVFSDSVLAEGRRLVRRQFSNAIEVMDLRAKADSQDRVISFIQELFSWQEAAADYWVSDWGYLPVYIIAKAAKESNARYAMVHTISIPELSNPYAQPFFTRSGKATLEAITLRIERGPWMSTPPGLGECVPVSATRSWTVQGWGAGNSSGSGFTPITGTVQCFVQTNNGDVLAGTNDQGWIYRSSDNGQHWVQLFKIGTGADSVNAFAKTSSGALFAAVTGAAAVRGIWKSTNNGVSWVKSLDDSTGQGFKDITFSVQEGILGAGGGSDTAALKNIVLSPNEGVSWHIPISHQSQYGVKAVAGQQEPVLASAYPNQPAGDPFNRAGAIFAGYDTYYTIAGVAYRTSNPNVFDQYIPGSGQMGNRGLDMAVFLHLSSQGRYYRKALWAVKSAADVTDTEIWQWPNPAGGFNFGKLATIDNKIFNVLYVDPVPWQNIPAQRTIWAGGNGEILVSYNNGLTWTVASTAPVNQVRAIIRTTAGALIAGGDSGEIFIYTGNSGSQGGNTSTQPPIGGGTVVNTYNLGMEESCDDDVVISNKSTFTNITHVLHFNGSTFSELQFAAVPPYELLGAAAVVNKAVYFGSKTSDSNVPGGTFSNVVFELTRIAENITVVWEYWNSVSWVALTVQDTTAGFRTMGVGSVHWVIPATWATTAVNGVTGYWIRARISAVSTNPVTPVHDNIHTHRYIYTANLPYVEVGADAVGGDLPAAAQIRWHNRSDDPAAVLDLEVDRMVCGLRSVNRGNYFNAYLNISDQQIPFGFSIAKDVDGIWSSYYRSPTNRILTMSYASAGRLNAWNNLVTFSLSNTIAREYYGSYRAFVRCNKYGAGTNNWQLRVRTSFGTGGSESLTKAVFPTTGGDWEVIDLGQLTIPSSQVSFLRSNLGDSLTLTVQGYCTATGIGLVLYDLILIPTDEWAMDTQSPSPSSSDVAKVRGNGFLDIDSITNPKVMVASTNRNSADQIISNYQAVTNGAAMLQTRSQQRLWFLIMSYENYWRAYPEVAGSVQAFQQQKYLAFRGAA